MASVYSRRSDCKFSRDVYIYIYIYIYIYLRVRVRVCTQGLYLPSTETTYNLAECQRAERLVAARDKYAVTAERYCVSGRYTVRGKRPNDRAMAVPIPACHRASLASVRLCSLNSVNLPERLHRHCCSHALVREERATEIRICLHGLQTIRERR